MVAALAADNFKWMSVLYIMVEEHVIHVIAEELSEIIRKKKG